MSWVVVALIVLVGLIAIPAVIGTFVPVKHRASRSIVLKQPPEAIWAVITDVESAASWRDGVKRSERLPDENGRRRFREESGFGPMTFEIVEATAPSRYVTRIVGAEKQGFGGEWTYELSPENGGTRVTVTEDGEIHNRFFRFMSRYVFGYETTLNSVLRSLAKKFGESAQPGP